MQGGVDTCWLEMLAFLFGRKKAPAPLLGAASKAGSQHFLDTHNLAGCCLLNALADPTLRPNLRCFRFKPRKDNPFSTFFKIKENEGANPVLVLQKQVLMHIRSSYT